MKLIKIAFGKKQTEMSYIEDEHFSKLMAKGHVRWDGVWLTGANTWNLFFVGLSLDSRLERAKD